MRRARMLSSRILVPLTLWSGLGLGQSSGPAPVFDDLRFRSIGPAVMGGRIDALAIVEEKPWILYVGSASGGIWKSTNKGTTWTPVFDDYATSSIGALALAPSDPEIVWAGTGEPNNRQSSSFGNGVYRSNDGGTSWSHMGLEETQHIGKVIVHPRDPETVFVAALGGLWSANAERGVYRTVDGGKTWDKVLYIDEDTGVVTMAIDPVNPNILYAASYQRRRTPWGFVGGGAGSGLHKTTDGGDTWRRLERGLPEGPIGRIGLDVFRGDPRLVYALVEHGDEGGLYRSDDRGESWTRVNELNPRPMYYSKIHLDPNDRDRIYVLGSSFHVSDDGGATFEVNRDMTPTYDVGVHGDHHVLWVDPENSRHLILGGDGGLYFSWDRSRSWDKVNNLPIAQFYAIAVDMEEPYNVYAGAQDTHSWGGPSATRNQIGILNGDWFQINFGDGMYQQVDPTDPDIVYTESQGGNIVRLDRRTGNRKSLKPYPDEDETRYRFHWTAPFVLSRHDPATLYLGGNRLFVSKNRGEDWTATMDLTRNEDRDELPIMEAVPDEKTLSRHDGVSAWGTITTVAESPFDPELLYVGTDDGLVQITRDGGSTWQRLEGNLPGFDPLRAKVSRVAASHASDGRVYASFDRHHLGDFAPYVFVSEDYGQSWRSIARGLPRKGWVNVVLEHPRKASLVFVGTETGLHVSFDGGTSWARMRGGLPTVPVDDVTIHPRDNDLIVGTHGRSIYILDDVTALEEYEPEGDAVQLFSTRRATVFLPWKHESYGAQRQFVGENPPEGALLTYFLGEPIARGTRILIRSPEGDSIRELSGPGEAGFHRVVWDLRTAPPEGVRRGAGVRVPPGVYEVELATSTETLVDRLEVVPDPRSEVTDEEFRARFSFLSRVNALRERLQEAVTRSEELEARLEAALSFVDEDGEPRALSEAAGALSEKLARARSEIGGASERRSFRNPSLSMQAARLFSELEGDEVRQGTLHGPTPVQQSRLRQLEAEGRDAVDELDRTIANGVAELNVLLREFQLKL